MRILLTLCVCCVLGIFGSHAAHADALVADLSEHLVKIGLGFTGKKVLLYGAIEGDGKVVVVVLFLVTIVMEILNVVREPY